MERIIFTMFITTLITHAICAQRFLDLSAGYGSENNIGNNGIHVSAGYQKYLANRIFAETNMRYFTTAIANQYNYKKNRYFPGEERRYNVLFLAQTVGYSIGNPNRFLLNLKAGVSAYYQSYKMFAGYTDSMIFRNGSVLFERRGVKYNQADNIRLACVIGINGNLPVSRSSYIGIGLDTYSHDIPLQFTQAYLMFKKQL